jgi:hypothetical protein
MSTLKTPAADLVAFNEEFLAVEENKPMLLTQHASIIPILEAQWKEKLPEVEDMPAFSHYLWSYRPQLLARATSQVAHAYAKGKLFGSPVRYPVRYYKDVVHTLRRKEIEIEREQLAASNHHNTGRVGSPALTSKTTTTQGEKE